MINKTVFSIVQDNLTTPIKSKQEIFDTVATHLLTQMERSKFPSEEQGCLYRGPGKLTCAVGCIIPDSLYTTDMEGYTAEELFRRYPIQFAIVGLSKNEHQELLSDLQTLHDGNEPEQWHTKLLVTAKNHHLNFT